jgi:hypothetical protein
MNTTFLQCLRKSAAVSVFTCSLALAQELPPVFPGVTTLGERTIPAPVGISPEMLEIVKARQIPPVIPAPETTEDWLELQALFDVAGDKLGRAAAAYNDVSYQVKEMRQTRACGCRLQRCVLSS